MSKWEKRWLPLGLALGTCGLVIMVLTVAHLLFLDAKFESAKSLECAARVFGIGAIFSCLACHFVDPGTPSPDPEDLGPDDEADDSQRIREQYLSDGRMWKQKWCRECRLWRPHRCGHCSMCERCVLRLDHHCGFMGACVGERNMRFFAAFLFCAGMGMACLLVLAFQYLSDLGCWRSASIWFRMWQPFAILLFFCWCPFPALSPTIGAPTLTGAGISYGALMLADTDLHSEAGSFRRGLSWNTAKAELYSLLTCRGARTHCLGPLTLRTPCRHDPPGVEELPLHSEVPGIVGAQTDTSPCPTPSESDTEKLL